MENIEEILNKLNERITNLESKRILQQDVISDAIKMRHIGEGVRFIRSGLEENLPTAESPKQGSSIYWATDTATLYIWDGTDWKAVTLT